MCGFTGILGDLTKRELDKSIYKMTDSLNHRGPDDGGTWIGGAGKIALGHRRLSIIDLSLAGHQPMVSLCGRYIIALNGEIYNHTNLRDKLNNFCDHAIVWNGHSDTETILAAISQWGLEETLQMITGMFSFALWDVQSSNLSLVRDRFGDKPLYYGWSEDSFVFGSELKAIRKYHKFNASIDRNVLSVYMRHMYIPAPYSIFKDIYKLEPGCILKISLSSASLIQKEAPFAPFKSKGMSIHRWYSLRDSIKNNSGSMIFNEKDAIDLIDTVLSKSIKSQLVSDVPVGAFLSGGIDSSLVVSLMQKQSANPVKTFTVGFSESEFNEAEQAKEIAKYLGTDHREFYVTPEDLIAVIPKLSKIYDEPFADSSQIPTYIISKKAREHVSVILSGDGGDELFGGYNRYFWSRRVWRYVSWIPKYARFFIGNVIGMIPVRFINIIGSIINSLPYVDNRVHRLGDKMHKLSSRFKSVDSLKDLYMSLVSEWQNPDEVVIGSNEPHTLLKREINMPISSKHELEMMYLDTISYLPDDILCKVDRASMSVGLETRIPMLDHRLFELAWRIPLSMKIRNGKGKWALRQVLYKYIPSELVDRPKAGFGIPIGEWLRGPLYEWSNNLLSETRLRSDGYFNVISIRKRWDEHMSGQRDWTHSLWAVLMFNMWLDSMNL